MTIKSENLIGGHKLTFNIGEIVKARNRLWRIDQIHIDNKNNHKFIYYSVSSITGSPFSQILVPSIEKIEKSDIPMPSSDKIGQPIYQNLLLTALKLDLIYGTSSFISLQNSKVIPISYQMVPVLMALNLQEVRLLLADDVGLGKTIEAGLIIQELLGRKRINRVLFITPANLREHWQTILRNYFGIEAVIMSRRNRRYLESELLVGGNPWGYYNFIIVSIDYAKRPGIKEEIFQVNWDMIVIDEAHNVMKPHLGTEDTYSKNFKKSYGFAKELAAKYPHLLLLTATPHNGYRDSYASLLELINPKIITKTHSEIKINRDIAINHICQRRRKDVIEWLKKDGYSKNPFPERDSDEIYITPSNKFFETVRLLNDFSKHVIEYSKKSSSDNIKLNYWTILHFHKRLISSPYALICSIENRLDEIDNKLNKKYLAIEDLHSFLSLEEAAQSVMDGNETDRLTEDEMDSRTDRLILTEELNYLKKEKELLNKVKISAKELMNYDSKIQELINEILPKQLKISKKIIIFTRYIDTLRYISKNIQNAINNELKFKNIELITIHGQMPPHKRQENYNAFLKSSAAILISTDCMSEGIDLHFSANQIINYELTWNPNRLEQRNGRIDRFGQPKSKVYIRTLILKDTLEMDILQLLVNKAYEIKKEYGFVPGFFGDPEAVIDHILKKRNKKVLSSGQTTLDQFINFSRTEVEDLLSIFFSSNNIKTMIKDSFYGHINIDLEEIEQRMRITEKNIGNAQTLLKFLKSTIDLYHGTIEKINDTEIYRIKLPDKIKKEIRVEFDHEYLISPNMEISSNRSDIEAVSLKNPLISGLIEKVKNEAFSSDSAFYGRTAAYISSEVSEVSAIYFIKIRYVVNTKIPSIMEEITSLGISLFDGKRLDNEFVNKIWNSEKRNHNKPDIILKRHLKKALELPNLKQLFNEIGQERLNIIIDERKKMIERLKNQGITSDLDGIDRINIVGIDLLTVTLVYPPINEVQ
ncbi:MAG: helicase-related protein [Candidatus Helarchaeota archaeon]